MGGVAHDTNRFTQFAPYGSFRVPDQSKVNTPT